MRRARRDRRPGGRAWGSTLAGRGAFLLVQTDGPAAADEGRAGAASIGRRRRAGARADEAEGERLLQIRRRLIPPLERARTRAHRGRRRAAQRLPAMFAAIERISAEYGLPIPTVAHAGDGNLHPNFVFDGWRRAGTDRLVWDAAEALSATAIELGGTLTGEHGVGVLKRRWLEDELGPEVTALSRRIKAALRSPGDPQPRQGVLGRVTQPPARRALRSRPRPARGR